MRDQLKFLISAVIGTEIERFGALHRDSTLFSPMGSRRSVKMPKNRDDVKAARKQNRQRKK